MGDWVISRNKSFLAKQRPFHRKSGWRWETFLSNDLNNLLFDFISVMWLINHFHRKVPTYQQYIG